ncbi:MAG: hypothetical protein ONB46_10365 [candidate division KSB1 bacterium]|nr:hypothetical protein [candidate division KSB1 bacterium]MDZ7366208.1 hypothetical protein [candidate division KSB1 bacterium]MDZ7404426.1 hypothetical protein [candidate division KSB1 bacterium]
MAKIINVLIPCSAMFFQTLFAQTTSRDEYLKGYETRAAHVTSFYDTTRNANYYAAAAKYAHNVNVVQADSMVLALLQKPSGDMFWMFPVIGTYLHGKEKMSPQVKAAMRNAWKTYAPYRGDTENHWCLYYASLFLATEQWPNLPGSEWYNGRSSDENREEAKAYLIHWIKITTTIGQGEFDSPDYLPVYMIPMLLLAQFAQDAEMKQRGAMMADYLLADFAVEHLAGQYIGGFSRIHQPAVYKPLQSPASAFAWLYFGAGDPSLTGWILFPALSNYRLSEIIHDLATDRSQAYIHKERKRVRNVIRFGSEKNPPVYKYTYMTKDYGLSSLHGGILQPIQQHTWSVRFTSGKPYTTIFGLHPYWSGYELAMFFPEEIKTMIADVVSSKETYNQEDKWTGSSPYERTFQHKNTLLVLYDIAPGTTAEHINGFFPKNLEQRVVDASGWIFCKAGDTYVGWYPLQEGEWKEEEENWRLRSHKLQNGYVVEVRSQAEAGSFAAFQEKLRAHIPKANLQPNSVSVDYTTLNGDKMYFAFPEMRQLNGKPVDLTKYKLFEGPFLNAEVGSEKLTMTYKNKRRVLDFKKLTITE